MKKNIAILMAVYNGGKFLIEQIKSLQSQTYSNWTLYVQDDLSTDNSLELLKQEAINDDRIVIVENHERKGVVCNFMSLLNRVEEEYYMFCDQDDVWLPQKIDICVNEMRCAENTYGNGIPIVLHTDLKVVDASLNIINESFWRMSRIDPQLLTSFNEQAGHNLVTGCTMFFNRSARDVSLHFNKHTLMHDVWVLICSLKHGGKVVSIKTPTMLYRQHGMNVLGAHDNRQNYIVSKMLSLMHVFKLNNRTYKMLSTIGYGNILKYLYFKFRYLLLFRDK